MSRWEYLKLWAESRYFRLRLWWSYKKVVRATNKVIPKELR